MLLTVVETPLFLRQAEALWTLDEREEFVAWISGHPDEGDVMPETGGLRKIRWRRAGSGRRSGVRVIYFYRDASRPLYLLLVYAKARQENLTDEQKRLVRGLVESIKRGS